MDERGEPCAAATPERFPAPSPAGAARQPADPAAPTRSAHEATPSARNEGSGHAAGHAEGPAAPHAAAREASRSRQAAATPARTGRSSARRASGRRGTARRRPSGREASRPHAGNEDEDVRAECAEMRWQLCRLAAGVSLGARGLQLARHVRSCEACDGYTDDLARVRAWLHEAGAVLDEVPGEREFVTRAREALARELHARLARDLLAVGQGRQGRPPEQIEADLQRLSVLVKRRKGAVPAPLARWAETGRPPRRFAALALAAELDPLGLDVALAWMGALVRHGRDEEAHRLADRLLAAAGADEL